MDFDLYEGVNDSGIWYVRITTSAGQTVQFELSSGDRHSENGNIFVVHNNKTATINFVNTLPHVVRQFPDQIQAVYVVDWLVAFSFATHAIIIDPITDTVVMEASEVASYNDRNFIIRLNDEMLLFNTQTHQTSPAPDDSFAIFNYYGAANYKTLGDNLICTVTQDIVADLTDCPEIIGNGSTIIIGIEYGNINIANADLLGTDAVGNFVWRNHARAYTSPIVDVQFIDTPLETV